MLLGRKGLLRRLGRSRSGRDTGTVPLVRPDIARASADPDTADPVFVDSTGRRARAVRRVVYGLSALCAAYAVVLVLSFMGATPFAPRSVLPVPGVPSNEPGTVRETIPQDLPGAPASPGVPSASPTPSISPTDVPGAPLPTPSESGSASLPTGGPPSDTPTTGGPSGTPSASTGSPGTSGAPTTSPVESGTAPTQPTSTSAGSGGTTGSPTGSSDSGTSAPPAASGSPADTATGQE